MSDWTIRAETVDRAEIDAAMREYFTEMAISVVGRPASEAELRAVLDGDPHEDLSPPAGNFLVARDERGRLLGYAGVRLLPEPPETAELKRMYVLPAGRGSGLGRGLLAAVEAAAADLGARRLVCETNTELTAARGLYTANGFVETPPYPGHGRADHWFAKDLTPDA